MIYKLIALFSAVSLTLGLPLPTPDDYDLIPGVGYYKFHNTDRSWGEAARICAGEGAHLFVINSQAEIDAVYQKYGQRGVWVGVRRVDKHNYATIDNTPLSSTGFDTWYSGFPRGNPATWPWVGVSRNVGLYNLYSTVQLTFICEIEL